jgi:hypothetical protein
LRRPYDEFRDWNKSRPLFWTAGTIRDSEGHAGLGGRGPRRCGIEIIEEVTKEKTTLNELASEGLETPAAAPPVADTRTTVADDTAEAGSVEQLKAARLAAKCADEVAQALYGESRTITLMGRFCIEPPVSL